MTMDRREFVTTGLAAVAAAATPLAQTKQQASGGKIDIFFKGQFVFVRERSGLYVSRVTADPKYPHNGYIFIRERSLAPDTKSADLGAKEVADEGGEKWLEWPFEGEITLRGGKGRFERPSRAATPSTGHSIPYPVDSDEAWNDRGFIPQLGTLAPKCEVLDNWRTQVDGYLALDDAKLQPRKPCTKEDVVSVWAWRMPPPQGQQQGPLTHVGAVTDLVSYPTMSFAPNTRITLHIEPLPNTKQQRRDIPLIIQPDTIIAALCAPEPMKHDRAPGAVWGHFQNVSRILKKRDEFPVMEYLTQSANPESVKPTPCIAPFRGDDIFCPGGEPPPKP